jgi:hypothetical protein
MVCLLTAAADKALIDGTNRNQLTLDLNNRHYIKLANDLLDYVIILGKESANRLASIMESFDSTENMT